MHYLNRFSGREKEVKPGTRGNGIGIKAKGLVGKPVTVGKITKKPSVKGFLANGFG
jgi:hypothetical protein